MPRHNNSSIRNNNNIDHNNNRRRKQNPNQSKIRKRASSSSSQRYYFKRPILSQPAATTAAVSTWNLMMAASNPESPFHNNNNNEHKFVENGGKHHSLNDHNNINVNFKGKQVMSARKLGATLWEINGLHSPSPVGFNQHNIFKENTRRNYSDADSDPPTPKIDGSKVRGHRRRSSAASQKLQIAAETANSIQVTNHLLVGVGVGDTSVKIRLKDVNNSLIASKELVKVLFQMISQEEHHSSRVTLVSALRVELDRARLQVEKLIQEQRSNQNQLDALLKQFAEEKAVWKSKDKERKRIGDQAAVSPLAREVEIERKLRRQAERLNKKLGMELADTRAQLSRAMKELDAERRGREVLEQTCDELARGIGEERVELEEMRRETAKAREDVEKERQMLQLADVLREERVQMKLAEARYEYEEKNEALERLKSEIASYYDLKSEKELLVIPNNCDGILLQRKTQTTSRALEDKRGGEADGGDGREGDSGGDSELHSIELNMDNKNRSYRWSFGCSEGNSDCSKRNSTSKEEVVFKGRRSLSDQIQWETICLQRNTTASDSDGGRGRGIQWEFTNNMEPNIYIDGLEDERRSSYLDEFKRKSYNKLPYCCKDSESPPISMDNSSRLREACSSILQDLESRKESQQNHKY